MHSVTKNLMANQRIIRNKYIILYKFFKRNCFCTLPLSPFSLLITFMNSDCVLLHVKSHICSTRFAIQDGHRFKKLAANSTFLLSVSIYSIKDGSLQLISFTFFLYFFIFYYIARFIAWCRVSSNQINFNFINLIQLNLVNITYCFKLSPEINHFVTISHRIFFFFLLLLLSSCPIITSHIFQFQLNGGNLICPITFVSATNPAFWHLFCPPSPLKTTFLFIICE